MTDTLAAEQANITQMGQCRFHLEVAETPEERGQGLMGRASLPQDGGMLFAFPEEAHLRFWMLNTLIPLDIVFLNSAERVVDVQQMAPEPGVPQERLTVYVSRAPARWAVELNAGRAETCGIRGGSQATLGVRG